MKCLAKFWKTWVLDLEKSKRSLEVAASKLEEAEKAFKHELFDATIVLSYTAIFHAARAILFRDGIIEKSHPGGNRAGEWIVQIEPKSTISLCTLKPRRIL